MFSVKWFTPTGVGTIAFPPWQGKFIAVHPHGRGDNALWRGGGQWLDGSPPRAWGQSSRHRRAAMICRFTPTGVGTMIEATKAFRWYAVHPHGRGDNGARYGWRAGAPGSPPRAWGQW